MLPNKIVSRRLSQELNEEYMEKYAPYFLSNILSQEKLVQIENMIINLMLKSKKCVKDEEFVSILLKLCIDCNDDQLNKMEFYSNLPINYCVQNIQMLNDNKRYHSVALIYYLFDQHDNAFEIWKKLVLK
jgi:hypothetical protein